MYAQANQAWTRRMYDGCKSTDDLRLTTGPGRYQINTPPQACNATFAPDPTIRQQKWGASLNATYTKTDVESDLFNINRPTTKTICNQYNPSKDKINKGGDTKPKEAAFPQTFSRLVDPPCTLRSSGWNRWEWLCQNPQEGVMMPFDNFVTTRLASKDQFRPCIPKPINSSDILPAPSPHEPSSEFGNLDTGALSEFNASLRRAVSQYPRGEDVLPAPPTALRGVEPNPLNPPSEALAPRASLSKL